MPSAQDRAFDIPELVEAILAQLSPRDLLLSQRISRNFQTVIKSSPRLQQTLFFRPAPFKGPDKWTLNPLLRKHFVPWFVTSESRWGFPDYESLEALEWNANAQKRAAFLHPNASWRRMLVVQPPPQELRVSNLEHGQCGDFKTIADISFEHHEPNGVTMDAIYDLSAAFVMNHDVSQFALSIHEQQTQGPKIELELIYTMQCCGDSGQSRHLMSKAQDVWNLNKLKFRPDPRRGRAVEEEDVARRTDLLPNRGGVTPQEFEKWRSDWRTDFE